MNRIFKIYIVLILTCFCVSMASCGQTGDLYLPEEDASEENKQSKSKKQS